MRFWEVISLLFILFHCKLVFSQEKLCDKTIFSTIATNCTEQEFLRLCNTPKKCVHYSLKQLTAQPLANDTITTSCLFPRILADAKGFIQCIGFNTSYPCPKSQTSTPRSQVCDGRPCDDCLEGSTFAAGPGFKCLKNEYYCGLPQELLYDNVADCENGEDLCFTEGNYNEMSEECFACANGDIIRSINVCNNVIDCLDLSDECLCQNPLDICNQVTPVLPSSSLSACKIGDLSCGDGVCINRSQVCDGVQDCHNLVDERNEYCGPSLLCSDSSSDENELENCTCPVVCSNSSATSSSILEPSDNSTCNTGINQSVMVILGEPSGPRDGDPVKCRTSVKNKNESFFKEFPFPKYEINREENRKITQCNRIVDCFDGSDEEDCPGYTLCIGLNGRWISIPSRKICDLEIDCLGAMDEKNCTDAGHFYCESGSTLFVKQHEVRNGRIDCEDGSDECQTNNNETNTYLFNSSKQLIENRVLYFLVWIMAVLALLGNTMVLIGQIRTLLKLRQKKNALASLRANHILILNLSIADILMGIYLLAVGIVYETFRGNYCQSELLWRGSTACTWMGITALIACEASVLILVLLTSCRLYTLSRPFKSSSNPRTWLVLLLTLSAWVIAFVVAFIPLTDWFHSYVPDQVLLPDNLFVEQPVVSLEVAKAFLYQSLVYFVLPDGVDLQGLVGQISNANTWDQLATVYDRLPQQKEQLQIAVRYGYYNIHSICIPDLFPNRSDDYWSLSTSIIIFNFVAFLYIAAAYISIYCLTFKNKETVQDNAEAASVQRKIFRIIVSNFLTWVPICILNFLTVSDYYGPSITGEVYKVAAIVLLPINSAMNPFLYSSILPNLFKRIRGTTDNFKKKSAKFGSTETITATKSTTDIL